MCGICGIYGVQDGALVERMLSVLRHRGPDDKGVYADANISLGHARLSIIDLSENGRQPMHNEDGDIWLSINGEIYNFQELRVGLERKGHRFYSNSDSEVIIHAYEEHGTDFLNRLRGMYALALYDSKKKKLVLARDPIGKKPLYYSFHDGALVFASEIKAILAAGVKKEINQDAVYAYLAYQYSLGKSTLFKGIEKVPAGHMAVLENGELHIQKYWDIKERIAQGTDEYFIARLRQLLEESVRLRMIADVPVGAFLSGGIDSSAIVALAKKHSKGEFHTFSVGFETFSELEYARIVSRHLGTVHHEVIITSGMVAKDLPRIAWHYDEPLGDAAIVNNYYLAQEARKHVKVVLAGEGGDELFAGYPSYERDLKYLPVFHLPQATRLIARKVAELIPEKGNLYSYGNRVHKFASFFFQPSLQEAHLYSTREMSDAEITYISRAKPPKVDDFAFSADGELRSPLNQMLAVDCKNLLPEKFLMKADKATMSNSVEERLPLLDKELIEFAFSVPPGLKIRNGQEKYILRRAVADLLPAEIINREKMGFNEPVAHWMQNALKEMVHRSLSEGELVHRLFKKERIEKWLQGWEQGGRRASTIWTLFALELWYDIYFTSQR